MNLKRKISVMFGVLQTIILITLSIVLLVLVKVNVDKNVEKNLESTSNLIYRIAMSYYNKEKNIFNKEDFKKLKNDILSIRIKKTGYPYIINLKGDVLVHPELNGNILNLEDKKGKNFIKEMINNKNGIISYYWENKNGKEGKKLVYYRYFPELKWIIAVGSFEDEFYELMYILIISIAIAFVVALLITIFITTLLVRKSFKMINKLSDYFYDGSKGDLTDRFPTPKVDCSKITECKNINCPCYEKTDKYCFIEVGTYAKKFGNKIQCPLITSGKLKSCRKCTVYKKICKDEIFTMGVWFNVLINNLDKIINMVKEAVNSFTNATTEISAGTHDLARRASDEAATIEEITASIEEMSANIDINQKNAEYTKDLSDEIKVTMGELNESSQKMQEIIKVIESISFETNLLALNASIEAARAGEAGQGFEVVASEVKELSQRSSTQAKEIYPIIEASIKKVEDNVKLVDNIVEKISEISIASKEQSATAKQISGAISGLNETTQKNAALVEEAASASEEITSRSNKLYKLVSYFKTIKDDTQNTAIKPKNQSNKKIK